MSRKLKVSQKYAEVAPSAEFVESLTIDEYTHFPPQLEFDKPAKAQKTHPYDCEFDRFVADAAGPTANKVAATLFWESKACRAIGNFYGLEAIWNACNSFRAVGGAVRVVRAAAEYALNESAAVNYAELDDQHRRQRNNTLDQVARMAIENAIIEALRAYDQADTSCRGCADAGRCTVSCK